MFRRSGGSRAAGQAVAELAILLPLLLALVGIAVDVSRAFHAQITLESATREAAEWAATKATSSTAATAVAKEAICRATQHVPGFATTAAWPGDPTACTQPVITITSYTYDTSAPLGSDRYPLVTVSVRTQMAFRPLFVYPLIPNGTFALGSERTFSIAQNRG